MTTKNRERQLPVLVSAIFSTKPLRNMRTDTVLKCVLHSIKWLLLQWIFAMASMTANNDDKNNDIEKIANDVADYLDADIILFNAPISRPTDTEFIEMCIERHRRTNVLMILVTSGGDADAAYRVARCIQEKYEKFILYVSGYCKSAGTMIATGAHELISVCKKTLNSILKR